MTLKPGGGKTDKLIRDALLAAQRQDPTKLKRLAEAWWERAMEDQSSASALADRIDGKAVQPIANDGEDPFKIAVQRIERVIINDPKD